MAELSPTLQRMVSTCSLPVALETMGERWSFMILLASFNGLQHFEEFHARLGIARNILASRLARLTERDILTRTADENDRRRVTYALTEKGRALLPTLMALRQWGERWEVGALSSPILVDTRDGLPVQDIALLSHDGRAVGFDDTVWRPAEEVSPNEAEQQAA